MEGGRERSPERAPRHVLTGWRPLTDDELRNPPPCRHTKHAVGLVEIMPVDSLMRLVAFLRSTESPKDALPRLMEFAPFDGQPYLHNHHLWLVLLDDCPACQKAVARAILERRRA